MNSHASNLPDGFVLLTDVDSKIVESARYNTNQNFVGRKITGYKSSKIACTKEAAEALKKANDYFISLGYKIVVYDGYRPQMAVDDFENWSESPGNEEEKAHYYPTISKRDLFKLGYIIKKSGHTRGSTFDLTLIKIQDNLKPIKYTERTLKNGDKFTFNDDGTVDMGGSFDLMHEFSHTNSDLLEEEYKNMRGILHTGMEKNGFKVYPQEWWHFTLQNEPFPDTYFNFIVGD